MDESGRGEHRQLTGQNQFTQCHQFTLSRWIYLRLLGVCYLIAFSSFCTQCDALIGSQGVTPLKEMLTRLDANLGYSRYWQYPTLYWIWSSDGAIQALGLVGVLLSLLVIVNRCTRLSLFLLWLSYLSVSVGGSIFFWYQWDALLLEAGLLAVFLSPPGLKPGVGTSVPPCFAILFLQRILLFKLMFCSGAVKLMSGDPTWRDLSALSYHYLTQPLPNLPAYYLQHAPLWFHQLSTALTLGLELFAPWMLFLGVWPRRASAAALAGLQLLIALTGSYTFFNLLSAALCLLMIDDGCWRRLVFPSLKLEPQADLSAREQALQLACHPFALVVLLVTFVKMFPMAAPGADLPKLLTDAAEWTEPLRSINAYGLFAVMTTQRMEIVIEGSNDGSTWESYELKYKPGALERRPLQAAPQQPRLDWQMWFAALGSVQESPWFLHLVKRLLEGSPPVLAQFSVVPFDGVPPKYIRALMYDYTFTSLFEKETEKRWWKRNLVGLYLPPLSLESFTREENQ